MRREVTLVIVNQAAIHITGLRFHLMVFRVVESDALVEKSKIFPQVLGKLLRGFPHFPQHLLLTFYFLKYKKEGNKLTNQS